MLTTGNTMDLQILAILEVAALLGIFGLGVARAAGWFFGTFDVLQVAVFGLAAARPVIVYLFRKRYTKEISEKRTGLEFFWSFVAYIGFGIVCCYVVIVLLGASLVQNSRETLTLATLMSTVTFGAAAFDLGDKIALTPLEIIRKVVDLFIQDSSMSASSTKKNALTTLFKYQARGSVFGAWLGAIPIILDWEMSWQVWPQTCVYGCALGFALATTAFNILKARSYKKVS